jgi:hypothetical protein
MHHIKPEPGICPGFNPEDAIEALYAFSDVLSWSRTVVERLQRQPADRKRFRGQGLIPALMPKGLRAALSTSAHFSYIVASY